ncbi:VOC family protein [Nocardia sp. NPDC003482]
MSLTLANIVFDCADAAALAGFWANLLDRKVDADANEFFATVDRAAETPTLMFLRVPDKTPGKNVVHLDLTAPDRAEAVRRAISAGARHIGDFDEYGVRWTTLADPEGNLFDVAQG